MRRGRWREVVVGTLACLLVAGCASNRPAQPTPSEVMVMLQTGRPLLTCREPCLSDWRAVQPEAQRLDARGDWRDLAILVGRTGYQDDLSLYYLGRAAEGLGYHRAAASYYRQSMQLSGTSISCQYLSRMCGGVSLPQAAAQRLAAIDDLLRALARRPHRIRRKRVTPTAIAPGPEAPATAPPASPPPPSGLPPEGATPPSATVAPSAPVDIRPPAPNPVPAPGSSEYIEPPPVR